MMLFISEYQRITDYMLESSRHFQYSACDRKLHDMLFGLDAAEIPNRRFEQAAVVIAGNVLVEIGADAFGVAHFAEDSAVGRRDAFDREDGTVGVESQIGGRDAVQIHVLRGDLPASDHLLKNGFGRDETSFPVRDRNADDLPDREAGEPRRFVGNDAGAHDA